MNVNFKQEKANTLNCEKCGNEIVDEKSGYCANCGASLNQSGKWDFSANSAILLFISAAFGLAVGVVGFLTYESYVAYYSYYGYSASGAVGFLLIAGFAIAAAALGLLSGVFSLTKQRFKLTLIGPVLMFISGIFAFIAETYYSLGYSDGITVPAVSMSVLSILALSLLLKSQKAFVTYSAPAANPEEPEMLPNPDESEQSQ